MSDLSWHDIENMEDYIKELEAERDRLREALAVYRKYVDLDVSHISAEDQALLEGE
jgi:hemerythrin-like domain-containing protein